MARGPRSSEIFGGDFLKLTVPWPYIVITLVLGVLAGMAAAVLPGIRAGRLDVPRAIACE